MFVINAPRELISPTVCSCTLGRYLYMPPDSNTESYACEAVYQAVTTFYGSECTRCPDGRYTRVLPPGTGAETASECERCAPGTFMTQMRTATNPTTCSTCPAGKFQPFIQNSFTGGGGGSICKDCARGRFVADNGVEAEAHASCAECPAGRFSNLTARTEPCDVCRIGRFSPNSGMKACNACPVNTYNGFGSEDADQDKHDKEDDCTRCPGGSMQTRAAFLQSMRGWKAHRVRQGDGRRP